MKEHSLKGIKSVSMVKRRIYLPGLSHPLDAIHIEQALDRLSGIRKISSNVDGRCIEVSYDVTVSDYSSIVDVLEQSGFPTLDNFWTRIKGGWYQYTDENAKANAEALPRPCCNKSPK